MIGKTKLLILLPLLVIFVLICSVGATSGSFLFKSNVLSGGQAATHEIQVDCGAKIILSSPKMSNFDLYALKRSPYSGTWPSENYIIRNYDKKSTYTSGVDSLFLDDGLWYVVVYAERGFGRYNLNAYSYCPSSYFGPDYDPCYGDPYCGQPWIITGNTGPSDPCYGDPCCGDPYCGGDEPIDPCMGDPCCGDPYCGGDEPIDPCMGDPCCGDPYCGGDEPIDPCYGDPYCGSEEFV